MKIKRKAFLLLFAMFCTANSFSQNIQTVIEITNVVINGGKVYLAIFFNADEFRREAPSIAFELESINSILTQEVSLPPGEYVISAFQDANNNQRLDFNFLGIPRELVGISNYSGRGFPSRNFDRQKIPVNNTTRRITLPLYRF